MRANRGRYRDAVSVFLELQVRAPLRGRVMRLSGPVGPEETFETAFQQEGPIEGLSPAARASMLKFAAKRGGLSLDASRPEIPANLLYMIDINSGATLETLRAVLDDMLETARAIETTM